MSSRKPVDFFTPIGEIPDDREALELYNRLATMDPAELPRAKAKLRAYQAAREEAGEPLWPSAPDGERAFQNTLEGYYLDQAPITGAGDSAGAARVKELGFLSYVTRRPGAEVAQSPTFVRRAVAEHLGKPEAGDSPEAFAALATEYLKKGRNARHVLEGKEGDSEADRKLNEGSLYADAWNSARDGKTVTEGYAAWRAAAEKRPEFADALSVHPELARIYQAAHEKAEEKWDDYRSRAGVISAVLADQMAGDHAVLDVSGAIPYLAGLTREERQTVLALVREMPGVEDKGVLKKTGELLWRIGERGSDGLNDQAEREGFDTTFVPGQEVPQSLTGEPAMLVQRNVDRIRERSKRAFRIALGGPGGFLREAGRMLFNDEGPMGVLTQEQADAANEERGRRREEVLLAAELRDLAKGVVDPVKGSNWYSDKFYYGALNFAGSVVTSLGPAGMALTLNTAISEERNRLESWGVHGETAKWQGIGLGLAGAVLERVGGRALAKAPGLTGLKEWVRAPAGSMSGAVARRATGAAGTALGEAVQEGVQQALPLVVQNTLAEMGVDEPSLPLEEIAKEAWAASGETFLVMLPKLLIGLGFGSHRDYKNVREIVADPGGLEQLGYSRENIDYVLQGKDGEEAVSRFREKWSERRPEMTERAAEQAPEQAAEQTSEQSPEQTPAQAAEQSPAQATAPRTSWVTRGTYPEAGGRKDILQDPEAPASVLIPAARARARFEEMLTRGTEDLERLKEGAGVVSLTRSGDGWRVETEEGTGVTAGSATEAVALMRQRGKERGIAAREEFYGALEDMMDRMDPDAVLRFTNEKRTLHDEASDARARLDSASTEEEEQSAARALKAVWDRANVQILRDGRERLEQDLDNTETAEALRDMRVYGKSETEFREGVARAVMTIHQGGRLEDVMEEWAEHAGKREIGPDGAGLKGLAAAVRQVERTTGDKYLHGAEDDSTAVLEAWSEIVRLSVTGTRRGDRISQAARGDLARDIRAARRERDDTNGRRARLAAAGADAVDADPQTRAVFQRLGEFFEVAKAIMGRAGRLEKARKEGRLGGNVEARIRRSTGLEAPLPGGEGTGRTGTPGDGPGATYSVRTENSAARRGEGAAGKGEAGEAGSGRGAPKSLNGPNKEPPGPNDVVMRPDGKPAKTIPADKPGWFWITEEGWRGYPEGVKRPRGPFCLLKGAIYRRARHKATAKNRKLRDKENFAGPDEDIHEIHPVKFGGAPVRKSNKEPLKRDKHQKEVTPWWYRLQRELEREARQSKKRDTAPKKQPRKPKGPG